MLSILVSTPLGYALSRPALVRPHRSSPTARMMVSTAAPDTDLVGDGGVLKRVMRAGTGASPVKGDAVEVHYEGTLLETGASFDSSRQRGKVCATGRICQPHAVPSAHARRISH